MARPPIPLYRVYIGNISYNTTKEELREFFVRKGVLAQVQFLAPSKHEGTVSGGFSFVTVLGKEQFDLIMGLNSEEGPHGRKAMLVREALPKPKSA